MRSICQMFMSMSITVGVAHRINMDLFMTTAASSAWRTCCQFAISITNWLVPISLCLNESSFTN